LVPKSVLKGEQVKEEIFQFIESLGVDEDMLYALLTSKAVRDKLYFNGTRAELKYKELVDRIKNKQ
jgi:hypothetical protein